MKVQITATAPTHYQLQSLRAFNLDVKKNGNGSYTGSKIFDTKMEARVYLDNRAQQYFDDEKQLKEAQRDIRLYGVLRLDAVSASINKIED